MNKAQDIFDRLNNVDEDKRIEAKNGSKIDRSLMETICSLSNDERTKINKLLFGLLKRNR